MNALKTRYRRANGETCTFRSRLEARWAIFFDALGVRWEYEPEGYDLGEAGWYLPDFWLPDFGLFVEVKGVDRYEDVPEEARQKVTAMGDLGKAIALVGNLPEPGNEVKPLDWWNWNGDIDPLCRLTVPVVHLPQDELVRRLFPAGAQPYFDDNQEVRCPGCGDGYVHFGEPRVLDYNDDLVRDVRGGGIAIPMDCESGCTWVVVLKHHKGNTSFAVKDVRTATRCLGITLAFATEDADTLVRAIGRDDALAFARTARFDRGLYVWDVHNHPAYDPQALEQATAD